MSGTTKRTRKPSDGDEGAGGKKAALVTKDELEALKQKQISEALKQKQISEALKQKQISEAEDLKFDVNYIGNVLFHTKEPVLKFAEKALGKAIDTNEPLSLEDVHVLNELLSGIRVEANYFGKSFRHIVKEVTEKNAHDIEKKFKVDDQLTDTTVAEIFNIKGSPVKHPKLQCLHMKTKSNFIYVPFEFCEIMEGQPRNGMLTGPLATFKIRKTRIRCKEKFEITSEFDCPDVKPDDAIIIGRIISPPNIQYAEKPLSVPNKLGLWSMADSRFFQPQPSSVSWALVSILPENVYPLSMLNKFADKLTKYLEHYGMEVDDPKEIKILDAEKELRQVLASLKSNVSLAIVVLGKKSQSYFELKENADYESSLITQCVTGESIVTILEKEKKQEEISESEDDVEMEDPAIARSYLNSLCMNINTKLGGINHQIISSSEILDESLVIIGAYTSSPDKNDKYPSVAAVLGCQNAKSTRYVSSCRVQNIPASAEVEGRRKTFEIQKLDEMTNYVLKTFLDLPNGTKPTRIVYLRNGVNPDDYKSVLEKEVIMIKKACSGEFSNVSLTYIMVTKEHSTYIETPGPKKKTSPVDESGNIKQTADGSSDPSEIKSKSEDSLDSSVLKPESKTEADSSLQPKSDDSDETRIKLKSHDSDGTLIKQTSVDSVDSVLKPASEDSVDSVLKQSSDDSVDSGVPKSEDSMDSVLKEKNEDLMTSLLKMKYKESISKLKLKSDLKPNTVLKTDSKEPVIENGENSELRRSDRKKRYPDAGAIVDNVFAHPQFFDFFITSQGNCKSALYTVMYDENNVQADQIEDLCFHLCFLYSKCSRSISYPAPITYARSLVNKARRYIRKKVDGKIPTVEEAEKLIETFETRNDMLLI